jgi:hypothetical protein
MADVLLSRGARAGCKLLMWCVQAAEHVQMLTRALAHQPYKFKVNAIVAAPLLDLSLYTISEARSTFLMAQLCCRVA